MYDEQSGTYRFSLEDKTFSSAEFADLMISWCQKYPIISIEDAMADTDWEGWATVYSALGRKVQLIGDDLFTTNIRRIEKGIERGVANAVLIKLNQIGTYNGNPCGDPPDPEGRMRLPVVSARSGETEDAFISHIAVASNAGQLKVGAFARSERMVKWNEVLRIERSLGERARFEGGRAVQIEFLTTGENPVFEFP